MKKSDVIKKFDTYSTDKKLYLTNLVNTIQREHIYKITNKSKYDHCLFRITHFYQKGIRTKVLSSTLYSRIPPSALHKWTFNWNVLYEGKYTFEEVPVEDLPLYVNETLTPYYKQTLGHTLSNIEQLDWVGKENNPIHLIQKRRKAIIAKRMKLLNSK